MDERGEKILKEWIVIQRQAVDAARYTLTFCLQHGTMSVSDISVNTLERNVVILCRKLHNIRQYQRCIESLLDVCKEELTEKYAPKVEATNIRIEEMKKDLFTLIQVIHKKIRNIKVKKHYTALFRSQIF